MLVSTPCPRAKSIDNRGAPLSRMIIAGIDPGTTRVGYAVIEDDRRVRQLLAIETITLPSLKTHGERLELIQRVLRERLLRDQVHGIALERVFFPKNTKTAIAVAEARGVILLTAREHVRSIWEYTPSEIKLAVAGYGNADKEGLRRMVRLLLPGTTLPSGGGSDDAIDAAAIALAACARELKYYES